MKTPRSSIRARFPITASDLPAGTPRRLFESRFTSPGKRVRRWTRSWTKEVPVFGYEDCVHNLMWGIKGRGASLHISPIWPRTHISSVRAWGTRAQMELLLARAVKLWPTLPNGREIETLFDRMFPAEIQLEADETIDKTKS